MHELFPVPKEMKNCRGGDLSGGQQQQLANGRCAGDRAPAADSGRAGGGGQPNIVAQIGEVIGRLIEEDGLTFFWLRRSCRLLGSMRIGLRFWIGGGGILRTRLLG